MVLIVLSSHIEKKDHFQVYAHLSCHKERLRCSVFAVENFVTFYVATNEAVQGKVI